MKTKDGYFSVDECDVGFLNDLVEKQAFLDNGDINPSSFLLQNFQVLQLRV